MNEFVPTIDESNRLSTLASARAKNDESDEDRDDDGGNAQNGALGG